MQFRPRLTSASVSPWVATTLSSLTPTITPQPVPQKRHGAFDHLISSEPMPPATGCAIAGALIPAAAAAMRRRLGLQHVAAGEGHAPAPMSASRSVCSNTMLADSTPSTVAISARRLPIAPVSVAFEHDDDLERLRVMDLDARRR